MLGAEVSASEIAIQVLNLRRDKASSVEALLGLLDWERLAYEPDHRMRRHYEALQAADAVLMGVALHAVEAENYFNAAAPESRQASRRTSRRHQRFGPGQPQQRLLAQRQITD
jgi:hypothetical protein